MAFAVNTASFSLSPPPALAGAGLESGPDYRAESHDTSGLRLVSSYLVAVQRGRSRLTPVYQSQARLHPTGPDKRSRR